MKVKFILLAMMLMLSVFFASCAKDEYDEEWEPQKKEEQTGSASLEELEPGKKAAGKTIDFILMGYGDTGQPRNRQEIREMVEELNKGLAEELNVQVSFTWAPYESYEEAVMEIIASDGGIDIVDMYPGSDIYKTLADNSMLKDISSDFKLHMPGTYKFLYEKYESLDDYLLTDGRQYFIPVINAYAVRDYILTQKELYLEYGEKVTTLEEYELYMDWILANKPDLTPGYTHAYDALETYIEGNGYAQGLATSFYRQMNEPLQAEIPMEQLPEFSEAYEMFARWHEKGFYKSTEGGNYQTPALNGKLASILVHPTSYTRTETIHLPTDIEYEYVVLYPETTMVLSPNFRGPSVLSDADASIEALQLFELLYGNRKYYDLIQYGIEGENYSLTGEKLSAPPSSGETIIGWWGSENFYNYTMERPTWSEPDDFAKFFEEISFENTITVAQLNKNLGIKDPAVLSDEESEERGRFHSEVISPLLEYRFEVLSEFYEMLYQGDFSMTAGEAAAMLHEANADELAEAYKRYRELLYKED